MIDSREKNEKHLSQDSWLDIPKKHRDDFSLRNIILGICSFYIATTNVSEKGLDTVIGSDEDYKVIVKVDKNQVFFLESRG